jgi:hypothetical protein
MLGVRMGKGGVLTVLVNGRTAEKLLIGHTEPFSGDA